MNASRPTLLLTLLLTAVVPALQGCFPVAAAGVTAGALAVSDRRTFATQAVDEEIELKTDARIREQIGDAVHINITSYNRKVLLTGEATSATLKARVADIAKGVPNVDGLIDEVQLAGTSSLTARSNDAYITTKVKARFLEANQFAPYHVKVVTEAGVVYLRGLVTEREIKAAIDIARTTGGVRKVVNATEVITDEQAKQLDAKPQQQAPAEAR